VEKLVFKDSFPLKGGCQREGVQTFHSQRGEGALRGKIVIQGYQGTRGSKGGSLSGFVKTIQRVRGESRI